MKTKLLTLLAVISTISLSAKNILTIVVVEGKALLVSINESGEVVDTYMEIKDYFQEDKNLDEKLEEAKRNYVILSSQEISQIRFIPLLGMNEKIDVFVENNLKDLAYHYKSTYANQIVITVAKNKKTEHLVEQTVKQINNTLNTLGVSERDIRVDEKIDMGDEPTQFVKVASNLKSLPTL